MVGLETLFMSFELVKKNSNSMYTRSFIFEGKKREEKKRSLQYEGKMKKI